MLTYESVTSATPLPGITVQACARNSLNCTGADLHDSGTTDENGTVTLELPITRNSALVEDGWKGYLLEDVAPIVPRRYYSTSPWVIQPPPTAFGLRGALCLRSRRLFAPRQKQIGMGVGSGIEPDGVRWRQRIPRAALAVMAGRSRPPGGSAGVPATLATASSSAPTVGPR